ncbi:MAG: hypothetical protein RR478_02705 [Bacilli bacterium]
MEKVSIVRNIKEELNQIIKGYESEPAKGLVHGFQKDAIQNSWGHRINSKKGEGWELIFKLLKNKKGEFLIVEDIGCTGLIGKNYTQDELSDMMNKGDSLKEEDKLARFSTLYNSGNNTTGAGTFGRGKRMYQVASNDYKYYFDSFTQENKYIANFLNERDEIFLKALEDEKAKEYIFNEVGLEEKMTYGTRVIIVNPKESIVEGIKSGKILEYIGETWWRILYKYDACIKIYDNDKLIGTASVPEFYKKSLLDSNYYKEYENIGDFKDHKIKRLGIGICTDDDNIPEGLNNIAYYRQDMKIGDIYSVIDLPIEDSKLKEKIYGFMEFERNSTWENELKNNEDLEHYGPKNRKTKDFIDMRKILKTKLDEFLLEKGFIKSEKSHDLNKDLNDLANDLTDFLKDCNFNFSWDSGKREKSFKGITIELKKYYPNDLLRTIENGQKMSFKINVGNITKYYNFKCTIEISNDLEKKQYKAFNFSMEKSYNSEIIEIDYSNFFKKSRNLVSIKVVSIENPKIFEKCDFPVFVEIDDQKDISDFNINFDYIMPHENSLSVYNDEVINDINAEIFNNTQEDGEFILRILTQDVGDRNNTISEEYKSNNFKIKNNSMVKIDIGNIIFGEKYYLRKGLIRIKFILIHRNGISNRVDGEKLMQTYFTIILNSEQEDTSIKPPFEIVQKPMDNKYIKSVLNTNSGENLLIFNTLFPLWLEVSKDIKSGLYKYYCLEEIFRKILQVQFENCDYSSLGTTIDKINDLSVEEIDCKIENVVSEYIGKYFEVR